MKSLTKILLERESLEISAAKHLTKFAKKIEVEEVYGTSRSSLTTLKEQTEKEAEYRTTFAKELKELVKKIEASQKDFKKRLKPHIHDIEKLNKKFRSLKHKTTDIDVKYHKSCSDCAEINAKIEKESDQSALAKLKTSLEKAEKNKDAHLEEHQNYEKKLKASASEFTSKVSSNLESIQTIEYERHQFWKSILIAYKEDLSAAGIPNDIIEKLTLSFDKIDIKRDMNDFIEHNKTGSVRPDGTSPVASTISFPGDENTTTPVEETKSKRKSSKKDKSKKSEE